MAFFMKLFMRKKIGVITHRHLPRHYRSRNQRVESSPPLTKLMKYAVPAVLALLTLQYQSKPHPAPLWCFAAATAVYWLIAGAMKRRKCFHKLWFAGLASGILSALSLLSMLLPHPVSLLPLLICLLLALIFATYTYLRPLLIVNIQAFAIWARGFSSENQPPNLPV